MAGISEDDIFYVGVGIPGTVNSRTNEVVYANNIGWKNVDFIPLFQQLWNVPVYLGNDADAAALAEVYAGSASGYDNIIMITLGTGVGGGFVFDKKLFTGNGLGTEPGHIIIVVDGEPCTCGANGCWIFRLGFAATATPTLVHWCGWVAVAATGRCAAQTRCFHK